MRIREPGTCTDNLAVCSRACISIRLGDHTGRLKLVWAQPALAGEAATKHPVATAPPFPAKDLWRVVPRCAACDALTAPPRDEPCTILVGGKRFRLHSAHAFQHTCAHHD